MVTETTEAVTKAWRLMQSEMVEVMVDEEKEGTQEEVGNGEGETVEDDRGNGRGQRIRREGKGRKILCGC